MTPDCILLPDATPDRPTIHHHNENAMIAAQHLISAAAPPPCRSVVSCSLSFAKGLADNLLEHAAEMARSEELGFGRAHQAAPPTVEWTSHRIDLQALGMNRKYCPFSSDELVITSTTPLLTPTECASIRAEAAALIADGAKSTFTMTDTNRDVPLHELQETVAFLNGGGLARVTNLAAACFPSAVDDPTSMWIYRGLVVNYDAAAGLTHQPMHRDGSLISCVIPLSPLDEYESGGTYVEPLGRSVALEQGCALLHPSAVRHAGHRITRGERWVLAIFLNVHRMHYAEHARRFRARAQQCFVENALDAELDSLVAEALEAEEEEEEEESGDAGGIESGDGKRWEIRSFRQLTGVAARAPIGRDEKQAKRTMEEEEEEEAVEDSELECLMHALHVSGGCDHEVFYDLGARLHERGEFGEALLMYEKAAALNPLDALLQGNMGAANLRLGNRRDALRCYRRALAADPHDANARLNAGDLLLSEGRLRALADLLASTPAEAMQNDEGLQELAMELSAAERAAKR